MNTLQNKTAVSTTLFVGVLCALSHLSVQQASLAASERDLEVIREVYEDNRERLNSFSCRFVVTDGAGESIEDAMKGNIRVSQQRQGLWLVHNTKSRYELNCATATNLSLLRPANGTATSGPVATGVPCAPAVSLFNGDQKINADVSQTMQVVNLATNRSTPSEPITPISLGIMNQGESDSPAKFIAGAMQGMRHCRYLGVDTSQGHPLEMIETGRHAEKSAQSLRIWYLDLAQGGLPKLVVFRDANGEIQGETRVLAVRQVPNGAFICEKAVTAWNRQNGVSVQSIELTEFIDSPPNDADLSITLSPEMKIGVDEEMKSFFRISESELMRASDLGDFVARARIRAEARTKEIERMTPPPQRLRWYRWLIILAAAIGVISFSTFIIRREYLRRT